MGLGDAIMATAAARTAKAAHPDAHVVIGNGVAQAWSPVFDNNPNITPPERFDPTRALWVRDHVGNRPYVDYQRTTATHLAYKPDFRAEKGEFFPTAKDTAKADALLAGKRDFVVIEPNTKGSFSGNKEWPFPAWQIVADGLRQEGRTVVQLAPFGKPVLDGVTHLVTSSFRWAWEIVARAAVVITTDGGLHHAARAVNTPAVVLWGARTHPDILGYKEHTNLYTGQGESCGSIAPCPHCREAMSRITVAMVLDAAKAEYRKGPKT